MCPSTANGLAVRLHMACNRVLSRSHFRSRASPWETMPEKISKACRSPPSFLGCEFDVFHCDLIGASIQATTNSLIEQVRRLDMDKNFCDGWIRLPQCFPDLSCDIMAFPNGDRSVHGDMQIDVVGKSHFADKTFLEGDDSRNILSDFSYRVFHR